MRRAVQLIRRVAFSSGHRYWRSDLTAEENRAVFGRWASPYNHGHNYVLWVGTTGYVEEDSGMVVNIKIIDDLLQERIVSHLDQRSLNDEVEPFSRVSPSLENLLFFIRQQIDSLPEQVQLSWLKLEETPLLHAEWSATQPTMIQLTRIYEFAASHRLHSFALSDAENVQIFGKCNNPQGHGHNYILEVTVGGEPDPETGMLVALDDLDRVVHSEVVDRYDHKNLNEDVPEFEKVNPTSENVALEIFRRLNTALPAKLERIRLHETARNVFEVCA